MQDTMVYFWRKKQMSRCAFDVFLSYFPISISQIVVQADASDTSESDEIVSIIGLGKNFCDSLERVCSIQSMQWLCWLSIETVEIRWVKGVSRQEAVEFFEPLRVSYILNPIQDEDSSSTNFCWTKSMVAKPNCSDHWVSQRKSSILFGLRVSSDSEKGWYDNSDQIPNSDPRQHRLKTNSAEIFNYL